MKKILTIMLFVSILLASFVSASLNVQLSDQGTGVQYSNGTVLSSGDLAVLIYDAASGGNLIYNETFTNNITNGSWNVMLGSGSVSLPLEFGKVYYKDYLIAGEDASFDGNDRQAFYSPLGDINGSKLINRTMSFEKLQNCSDNQILKMSSGEWVCSSDVTGASSNDTIWNITTSNYLINSSGILEINETKLDERYSRNGTNLDLGDKNITTTNTGFFGLLGSLVTRITGLFIQDIDFNGTISSVNGNINITASSGNIDTFGNLSFNEGDNQTKIYLKGGEFIIDY